MDFFLPTKLFIWTNSQLHFIAASEAQVDAGDSATERMEKSQSELSKGASEMESPDSEEGKLTYNSVWAVTMLREFFKVF